MTDQTLPLPEEVELVPGSPEYDAMMAEKFDDAQPPVEGGEDRPGWLPEKFQSPEDLAKAYAALEKKLGAGTAPAADEADEPDAGEADASEEAREVVEGAGLDFDTISSRYTETGQIADEDYAALEKAGISRSMVDAYVAGQEALAAQLVSDVFSTAGGQDAYVALTEWAGSNLPADEVNAFNNVVDGGDMNAIKLAVSGLKARYEQANGAEPRLLTATNQSVSGESFRSTAELTAAMRDPRYKTDPAYRADVQAKLSRSNSVF